MEKGTPNQGRRNEKDAPLTIHHWDWKTYYTTFCDPG